MFSTQDVGNNRRFVVYANSDGVRRELTIPDNFARLTSRASNFPIQRRLKKLGIELLKENGINPKEITSMDFQLYKLDFDKKTLSINYNLFETYKINF